MDKPAALGEAILWIGEAALRAEKRKAKIRKVRITSGDEMQILFTHEKAKEQPTDYWL